MRKEREEKQRQIRLRDNAHQQKRQHKIQRILSEALENKEVALPKNTVKGVVKFFNLMIVSTTTMGKAYKIDLFFAGLIDREGALTEFGKKLMPMNDTTKARLIKQEILKLPKMQVLKEVFPCPDQITIKRLQEKIPVSFFGNYSASTKVHLLTKLSSWLK